MGKGIQHLLLGFVILLSLNIHANCQIRNNGCSGMNFYDQWSFNNSCSFTSSSSNDVECHFLIAAQSKRIHASDIYITRFNNSAVLFLKERLPDDEVSGSEKWCLGLRSLNVKLVLKHLARNAERIKNSQRWVVVETMNSGLRNLVDWEAEATFYKDRAVGFMRIQDGCSNAQKRLPVLNKSCILEFSLDTFIFALFGDPRRSGATDEEKLTETFDLMQNIWFTKLGLILQRLRIRSTVSANALDRVLKFLAQAQIKDLDVSNNDLGSLDLLKTFENYHNLTKLAMRDCGLTGLTRISPINQPIFDTPNLESLDLCGNDFSWPPTELSTLTKLRAVKLCYLKSTSFSRLQTMKNIPAINNLSLDGVFIQEIGTDLIIKKCNDFAPASLEHLHLSKCGLTSLPKEFFALPCKPLKSLYLSSNKLSHIDPNLFFYMAPGATLDLTDNELTSPSLVINSLFVLNLARNSISLPENAIKSGEIEHLDLSMNKIRNWTSSFVTSENSIMISSLNLSHNLIAVIDSSMVNQINSLKVVDIGGNPFDCQHCLLPEFQHFVETSRRGKTEIRVLNQSNDVRCVIPQAQAGVKIVDAEYNAFACGEIPSNIYLLVGIPVAIVILIIVSVAYGVYRSRYKLAYMRHLYRIRKKNDAMKERTGCRYDLFVSYCSKDRDWVVDVLLSALENPTEKYSLCLHERDFTLGRFIIDNIVESVDRSRRTMLVLTKNYLFSEWCKWELQMAQNRIFEDSPTFLVLLELERLDRSLLPDHLRILMNTRTYLEWPGQGGDLKSFWAKLREALGTPLAVTNPDGVSTNSEEDYGDLTTNVDEQEDTV